MSYVYIELETLEDLLDHAEMVPEVLYKCEKVDDDIYHFKILAGKIYWEGLVRENDEIYERLMQMLEMKGKKIRRVYVKDQFAEVWRE